MQLADSWAPPLDERCSLGKFLTPLSLSFLSASNSPYVEGLPPGMYEMRFLDNVCDKRHLGSAQKNVSWILLRWWTVTNGVCGRGTW